MRLLVTGGAGFIGTHLVNKLKNEHEITIFDNFLEQVHGKIPKKISGVDYVIGDVANIQDWEIAMSSNPDIIIHLASDTGTGQSMDEIIRYCNTNIMGTSIMIDILNKKENNVKKVILSSSRAVYGDENNSISNCNINPKSIYGVTKLTQELLIKTSLKIPYTILRYQNVYGDGQSLNNQYTGIISIFSKKLQKNESIEVYDQGIPTRDFIYVGDVVEITSECIFNKKSNNKIYNVGTGESTKILDVVNKLKELYESESKIEITSFHRDGDVIHAIGDISETFKDLNWSHKYSLDYGLNKIVEWVKNK
jgi:dTDP-L-rhamnose 4-epimerase